MSSDYTSVLASDSTSACVSANASVSALTPAFASVPTSASVFSCITKIALTIYLLHSVIIWLFGSIILLHTNPKF